MLYCTHCTYIARQSKEEMTTSFFEVPRAPTTRGGLVTALQSSRSALITSPPWIPLSRERNRRGQDMGQSGRARSLAKQTLLDSLVWYVTDQEKNAEARPVSHNGSERASTVIIDSPSLAEIGLASAVSLSHLVKGCDIGIGSCSYFQLERPMHCTKY
ncbi:hypothetical protein N658DRAFT_63846 [Parathielavia hyrcaniae]|uniref:Uncharacterized protein n=1 Tax=Parathielavia hyrcaniae TaxID=113614 RepID=A0AAN6Q4C5_9PEZI|nr:hypothetical protein N658DRAFT_63846 [Parathielavia hyrcaniae]